MRPINALTVIALVAGAVVLIESKGLVDVFVGLFYILVAGWCWTMRKP